MSEKIHRGKIKTPPDPLVVKYLIEPGIQNDIKYRYQAFLDCNKAHVLMLAKQGIVTRETAAAILRCNDKMAQMGDKPDFPVDPGREDFYFNIEAHLIEEVGIEIGGQQHTARSRNDLYATCARLAVRKAYFEICEIYNRMRQAVIETARKNTDAVFAGYTHMQPSEPITFAHYCSAVLNAMQRDFRRISLAFEGLNVCPLGAGSMGSTTWNIDRNYTAKLLGFEGLVENSMDCVCSRDYLLEIMADISILASTLVRMTTDMRIWATPDYGYVEVADKVAVCSSIMPQKKNPWTFESSASFTARIKGYEDAAWMTYKGVPYAFTMESMDLISNFWPCLKDIEGVIRLLDVSMKDIKIRKDRARRTAAANFCTVTELANTLVRDEKLSFRAAHEIVAHVVGYLTESDKKATDIDSTVLNRISRELFGKELSITDAQIQEALDPVKNAYSKTVIGGTAPEEVNRQLSVIEAALTRDEAEITAHEERLTAARDAMNREVDALIASV